MQWTKIFGSKKVVVFDISDERLALAKRLGADEVINTKEEGYMEKASGISQAEKDMVSYLRQHGQVPTMHMAFELAANKAHVCFIGTPHENLTFTPKQWENMNRKEFDTRQVPGCLTVHHSRDVNGICSRALLCNRSAEI